jgi:hypothetical protein
MPTATPLRDLIIKPERAFFNLNRADSRERIPPGDWKTSLLGIGLLGRSADQTSTPATGSGKAIDNEMEEE